jgi:hypothetical protein
MNRAVLGLLMIGLAGCQPSTPPPTNNGQPLPEFHGSLDQALNSDECSAHMQNDIEQALAIYLLNNRNQLPDTLEQLKQVPGIGPTLNLNCPVTGTPYIYSAAGLFLPPEAKEEKRRVILWEPTPSHHGCRACLLIPRLVAGQSVAMEVKPIPEVMFQKAVPPIQ